MENFLTPFKYLLAAILAASLAACGGGEAPQTLSSQKFAAAQSPQALVTVTPVQAAEQLLNAAEGAYPGLFPVHQSTASYGPFAFRYYPQTDMYIGVSTITGTPYVQNGIYVVGTGFGTLANPAYQGLVTQYLSNLSIVDPLASGNKTLVITVNVLGTSSTINVGSVPAPTSQTEFCSELQNDTSFSQIFDGMAGTLTINSCSFSGSTGNVTATLSITSPYVFSTTYTITYAYQ